uniref:Uncharacterized protein n=1 Tax=Oryza sativa subsp. japonica TaxID=39947 RepID=Q6H6E8_ORYSJ|nr:hypothetical protein [Oryza sativa Japonica Group]
MQKLMLVVPIPGIPLPHHASRVLKQGATPVTVALIPLPHVNDHQGWAPEENHF